MGNCCFQSPEFVNYQKIKKNTSEYQNRQFIWGCKENEESFFYFLDMVSKNFHPLKIGKVQLYNLAGAIQLDNNRIFMCGGVSYSMRHITRSGYIYHIDKHSFRPIKEMINYRFNFPFVFFDKKVYAIGGRKYGFSEDAISNDCEVFCLDTSTWSAIAPLNYSRSGSKSLVYRGKIWVFGGNNFNKKGRVVEVYEKGSDKWTVLNMRLPFDYFNFSILSFESDKVLIFAGANSRGMSRHIHCIDLEKQTIINKGCFLARRAGFKLFYSSSDREALIFGGTNQTNELSSNFAEIYSFVTNRSKSIYIHNNMINNTNTEMFNNNIIQVNVASEPKQSIAAFDNNHLLKHIETKNILFGTDNEPFIITIDAQNLDVKVKPIPWNLKLKNHQGAVRIDDKRVLFAGGVNYLFNKVYDRSFIYNLKDKSIEKLPPMAQIRFFFATSIFKDYVYVMGGRSYGNDRESIIGDCERFSIITKTWHNISPLNKARCQASSYVFRDKLYIAGGLLTKGTASKTIEVYNESKKRWEILGTFFKESLMGLISINFKDQHILFIGGINYFISPNIHKLSMDKGADLASWDCSKISEKHYLAKYCRIDEYFMIFGGLNDDLEYFNATDFSPVNDTEKFKQFTGLLMLRFFEVNCESYGLTKCSFVTSIL